MEAMGIRLPKMLEEDNKLDIERLHELLGQTIQNGTFFDHTSPRRPLTNAQRAKLRAKGKRQRKARGVARRKRMKIKHKKQWRRKVTK
jgi:hypothetical protein